MQSKKTDFKTCFFGLIGWILSKEAFDEIRILFKIAVSYGLI
ncbi:Uncharacterised protein [Moraxella catarrhalis]|nr:Uncharacterised protein [Moraxella catarrhalis]